MKLEQSSRFRGGGFVLLEALIALLIVSLGLLAIAGLLTKLLAGTGASKARSEAVALAEQRQEQLRNTVTIGGFTGNAGNSSDSVAGINATFNRQWNVCDRTTATNATTGCGTANSLPLNSQGSMVQVAWTDPKSGAQSVSVSSILAWYNPLNASTVENGGLFGGGTVQKPTGKTTVGGSPPSGVTPTATQNNNDGTTTKFYPGQVQLTDSSGNVLLSTVCPTQGNSTQQNCGFSTISGYVYIDGGNNANPDNLFVLTSDAAYCTKSSAIEVLPVGASGNAVKYRRFYYQCYVGPGWFGRVGIVRTDNANTNDRVCIGDPSSSATDATLTTTKPQLATTRDYRGFKDSSIPNEGSGAGPYDITVGIGMDATNQDPKTWPYNDMHFGNYDNDNDGNLVESGTAIQPADFDNTTPIPTITTNLIERQDFLVTTISGQPDDANCKAKLELISTATGTASPFYRNAGKFVCLTRNTGGTSPSYPIGCPTTYPTNPPPTTVITLTFDAANHVASVATDGGTCTAVSGTTATCTIDWTGWIGSTWTGTVTVTPKTTGGAQGKVCNSSLNVTSNVLPVADPVYSVANPAQSGGDSGVTATQVPLVLTYTGVEPAIASFAQTVRTAAKTGACP